MMSSAVSLSGPSGTSEKNSSTILAFFFFAMPSRGGDVPCKLRLFRSKRSSQPRADGPVELMRNQQQRELHELIGEINGRRILWGSGNSRARGDAAQQQAAADNHPPATEAEVRRRIVPIRRTHEGSPPDLTSLFGTKESLAPGFSTTYARRHG
jgi:hypothetical protein